MNEQNAQANAGKNQAVFGTFPVASGSNRLNASGTVTNAIAKNSSIFVGTIGAGATLPIPMAGTTFYVIQSSGIVQIRPAGQTFQSYVQGTGLNVDPTSAFALVELYNSSDYSITIQLFVGFGQYIDNRLIIASTTNPNVLYPTSNIPNTATQISIPDLSGQAFVDGSGNYWFALSRVSMLISNLDAATPLFLQPVALNSLQNLTNNTSGVTIIQPLQTQIINASGWYGLKINGVANVNAIVSEIYSALEA